MSRRTPRTTRPCTWPTISCTASRSMPPPRPLPTRVRSTSPPLKRPTDPVRIAVFTERAAFGSPFLHEVRTAQGQARKVLWQGGRGGGTAAALTRRGIVSPVDSGRSMAEAADDLSTPLGQETVRRKRRFRLPFSATQALAVLLGLFLVTFIGFALFNDNPLGGEPAVRVAIRQPTPAEEKSAAAPSSTSEHGAKSPPKQAAPGEQKTVTIIDGSSGARHDMVIGSDGAEKAEPDAAPVMMAGIDQRLLANTRHCMT